MTDLAASRKPSRMSLTNLNNGRSLEAQFNPEELTELLEANWNNLVILGMSHEPSQYSHTSNQSFEFTLTFDALDNGGGACVTHDPEISTQSELVAALRSTGTISGQGRTQNRLADILLARNYLLSLFYAPQGAQDVSGGAPPRFLFVWPNLIVLTCKIDRCRIRHRRFNLQAQTTLFQAEISISEIRDVRLHSDEVFYDGTIRSPAGVSY